MSPRSSVTVILGVISLVHAVIDELIDYVHRLVSIRADATKTTYL